MFKRDFFSSIILSTIPHFLSLVFTFDNFFYSSTIITSTLTSILWHRYKEPTNILLYLDYGSATILSFYEIYNSYLINDVLFVIALSANFYILVFNKLVYFLSVERVINYNIWHTIYHLLSAFKTILIAFLCNLMNKF